jgi:hypothetical protein
MLSRNKDSRRVLSDRLAASLLMVDFSNPVFSARREALLKYVPASATLGDPARLETEFVQAVTQGASGLAGDSAEAEFLANWAVSENDWRNEFARRIRDFMAAVTAAVADPQRFSDIFRLIDSRRREFRRRPLAEFRLTVPASQIPRDGPFLELTPDAKVREKL